MAEQEALVSGGAKKRFSYGYVMVVAGFFALFVTYGAVYSFGVFFKPVSADFGWSRAETSAAYSLYMLCHGAACMVVGRLGDRFQPRVVMTVCGVLLGAGFLLMSRLTALWQFYFNYSILIGAGVTGYVPLVSQLARWFPKRRGLMTGIVVSGIGGGTVVMPPLATQMISVYDWSLSYLILGALTLVVVVATAQFMRRVPPETASSGGEGEAGSTAPETGAGIREALRSGQFWKVGLTMFTFMFAQQIMMVHIIPHVTDLGISAVAAASVLSVIGGISVAGRLGLGMGIDRFGSRAALVSALALVSAGLLILVGAGNLPSLYVFAVIFGLGYGGMVSVQSPIVAELFGLRSHGAILGVLIFIATLGGAVGPIVAGGIFDSTGAYRYAFVAAAILGVIGLAAAVMVKRSKRTNPGWRKA